MCGIVAYVGRENAVPYLINSLEKLEYRGYDSAGIAILNENKIKVIKRQGSVESFKKAIPRELFALEGIGHTRWATHGRVSQINAHPHLSQNGTFAVVHNGIIENSMELRGVLENEGYSFLSDTDTEAIAHLLERNYHGDLLRCISESAKMLKGSFALGIIHAESPGKIICLKKDSPLIVAQGDGCTMAISDLAAIESCREYYDLADGEIAFLTRDEISFYTFEGEKIRKKGKKHEMIDSDYTKGKFEHYMLKEIYDQPKAVYETVSGYIKNSKIEFPKFNIDVTVAKDIERIYLVGCGSAYHGALCAVYALRELTGLDVSAHIASEFRYDSLKINGKCLTVFISQSGETADTLGALSLAREKGAMTLCVINVKDSAMSKKSHHCILTLAGREVSVATTKAYTCQIVLLYMIGAYLGDKRGVLSKRAYSHFVGTVSALPQIIKNSLKTDDKLIQACERLKGSEHIYFIGRCSDYALAMEGALKMKEISYIHCEAYAAGELKHGSIALINEGTPVIALCLNDSLFKKTQGAISEVKSRGAFVIVLTSKEHEKEIEDADIVISCEKGDGDLFSPFGGIVPMQLMSYYVAKSRGLNVDRPRNLAKSVTVE